MVRTSIDFTSKAQRMEKPWTKSVTLALEGPGKYVTISNITEASWAMIEDWPLDDAPALNRALDICAAAVEGKRPAEDARKAFIEAAAEAEIHVQE
jgi:Protein of unknown function (DUF982)